LLSPFLKRSCCSFNVFFFSPQLSYFTVVCCF
jgi:hypothetical protein